MAVNSSSSILHLDSTITRNWVILYQRASVWCVVMRFAFVNAIGSEWLLMIIINKSDYMIILGSVCATREIWFTCNVHTYIIVYFYCVSFILRFCKRNTFEMKWIWKHLAQTNSWGIFLFFVVCDFVKMMLFCRNIFKWIFLVLLVWYIGVGDWFIYFCVSFINVLLRVFSIC